MTLVTESIYDRSNIDDAKVYNIDLKTGKVLTNAEVMELHSIDDSKYELTKILKEELRKKWSEMLEANLEHVVDFYNNIDNLDLKLSKEKFYFDDNNELHVFFSIPYVAGPSGNHYIDIKI